MNVDDFGVISILLAGLCVAAMVLPCLWAVWQLQTAYQMSAALVPVRADGTKLISQTARPTPKDVLPANQAWRAPPTFLALFTHEPGDRSRRA